jgi:hypothetical protein
VELPEGIILGPVDPDVVLPDGEREQIQRRLSIFYPLVYRTAAEDVDGRIDILDAIVRPSPRIRRALEEAA